MLRVFDPATAGRLEAEVRAANDLLARREEVPPEVFELVERLAAELSKADPERDLGYIDPYLALALHQGAIDCLLAMQAGDAASQRRRMRVGLERMRHALRDIAEDLPVSEERTAKEIVRWLADRLDVPQHELADLLGTSHRTLQRWVSSSDPAEPRGADAHRVRVVARIANQLRHALTGPGVVRWFLRRHPALRSKRPVDLLQDPAATERLIRLAATARSAGAA